MDTILAAQTNASLAEPERTRAYFETTMFNFYHAPDLPGYRELKAQTRRVFELVTAGKIEAYTSDATVNELENEQNANRRELMTSLIRDYSIKTLETTPDVRRLAGLYIGAKAVPESYPTDAAHIAITSVYGLDYIVSLNFEHISRPWTIERVRKVNKREGFSAIGIYKPQEVLDL
jgi:predicted nucleic acid-binding protein